jgi:hypothetical protein
VCCRKVWTGIQYLIECTFNAIDTHWPRFNGIRRNSVGLQSNFVENSTTIECSFFLKKNKTRQSIEEVLQTMQEVSNAFQSHLMELRNIQCF